MNPELRQQAWDLRKEGWTIKAISEKIGVSTATVSCNVRGALPPHQRKKKLKSNYKRNVDSVVFEEEVFADKQDDVLFQHVRPWDFIG